MLQKIGKAPVGGALQPGIQRDHGQIQRPALQGGQIPLEIHFHVAVPGLVLPLPVPPVEVTGVVDGAALRRHHKGHALVGGGQRLHGDAGQGLCAVVAAQRQAFFRRLRRNAPAGEVPLRQADIVAQQEADGAAAVIQGEDGGIEMILVAVAGKDQQRLIRRQGRKLPFPPVKEQAHLLQFHRKAAVGQERHPHHRYFTAVP